jgi:hypothetical protein
MSGWRRLVLLLLSVAGLAVIPLGQVSVVEERTPQPGRPLERVRERLQARPAPERERLETNLDQFERLPKEVRARLLQRARILRERERAFERSVTRELRQRLQELRGELGNEKANELWRAWLRESLKERGCELRKRMPEKLRRRLEEASPETRRRVLERLLEERETVGRRALARLRERFGLPPSEIRRLERLPFDERLRALRELALRGR